MHNPATSLTPGSTDIGAGAYVKHWFAKLTNEPSEL
jgi:hypothetical protein